MPLGRRCWLIAVYALMCQVEGLRAAETPSANSDVEVLKSVGLADDSSRLLAFFRARSRLALDAGDIEKSIAVLGSADPAARGKAMADLVAQGALAIPQLRRAASDIDNTTLAEHARRCLEAISNPYVPAAAARLLAQRHAAGAARALLDYLPFADDAAVAEDVEAALQLVASHEGKPDPALLQALEDPLPTRRAAAAVTLCHVDGAAPLIAIRKLLHDPKPTVRLRVALALGDLRDEEAIGVLIQLIGELPFEEARQAEEFLQRLAGESASVGPLANDPTKRQACRDAWNAWWQGIDDAALLDYFRKRTLSEKDRKRIEALVRQLGDENFAVREKASAELLALGPPAVPVLRQASRWSDVEIVRRAEDCLVLLDKRETRLTAAATARLLALRKPAGALEVVLGFTPFADTEQTIDAVRSALVGLAVHDGQAEPRALEALGDSQPLRRAFAAEALCAGQARDLDPVRRLLTDRDPLVRMRVSLALLSRGALDVVPVLIGLLGKLAEIDNAQVEEVLYGLAGEGAPERSTGGRGTDKEAVRRAWLAWWQAHGSALDVPGVKPAGNVLGYTLLLVLDNGTNGSIREVDRNGKTRWQIAGLRWPTDAQVLPGNRVLVSELYAMQVTERDFHGNVLWQKQITMPLNCQRLANGHTFVAGRSQLIELDRNHVEILTISRPGHDVAAARKLANGQIVCLTMSGHCLLLDATGHEINRFRVGQNSLGTIEVLRNGHILLPQPTGHRVVEYDDKGHIVWEARINSPASAQRLPDGHTLVAQQNPQRVVELDSRSQIVWDYAPNARTVRATRR